MALGGAMYNEHVFLFYRLQAWGSGKAARYWRQALFEGMAEKERNEQNFWLIDKEEGVLDYVVKSCGISSALAT